MTMSTWYVKINCSNLFCRSFTIWGYQSCRFSKTYSNQKRLWEIV